MLFRGVEAFEEAEEVLLKTRSMKPLVYDRRLNVRLPENEEQLNDKEFIKSQIKEMKSKGIPIKSFYKDNIKDPEIAFLLMIVDDYCPKSGMKRKDILDPNMKSIGLVSTFVNNRFVCYMSFGK